MVAPLSSSALPRALLCSAEERAALPHGVAQIAVVGSLNMDVVMRVARAPQAGETVLADTLHHIPGGKGGNQAVACLRHGAQVVLMASVGRDHAGNSLRLALHAAGMEVDYIQVHEGVPTGTALILIEEDGSNRICVAPGANAQLALDDDALLNVLAPSDFVLLQLETPLALLQQVLEAAQSTGCRVVLNPSPVLAVPAAWWPQIHTLVVNEVEAAAYSALPVTTPQEATHAARLLLAKGVQQVVITLGAQGAVAAWRSSADESAVAISVHAAWPVLVVDTTAAGDTFLGALVTRLAEGCTLAQAVDWGIAAASLCISQLGAQPSIPARATVEAAQATRKLQ